MMGAGIYKKKEVRSLRNDATVNMNVMPERILNQVFVVWYLTLGEGEVQV
jgi:hypothetical protein